MIEVLLVDDEAYLIETLVQTIPWKEMGVQAVHRAYSGQEALDIIAEQSIDIIVTDIRMPEMTGLELIQIIKGNRDSNIKCILLTGYAEFEYAKKAVQLQTFDYLLKPINDEEFITVVTSAVEALMEEWQEASDYQHLRYSMQSELSLLRGKLIQDMLMGRRLPHNMLLNKLETYEIPLTLDSTTIMLLLRPGQGFSDYGSESASLLEYAITNIAEEVMFDPFHVCTCKSIHEDIIVLLQPKMERTQPFKPHDKDGLLNSVESLQKHVSDYLKVEIAVVISRWFNFPDDIAEVYRTALSVIYTSAEGAKNMLYRADEAIIQPMPIKSLESLYKPPTLVHLLESKQWEAVESKINTVFDEMSSKSLSIEHGFQVFFSIVNALAYMAHREGWMFSTITGMDMDTMIDRSLFRSLDQIRARTFELFYKLKVEMTQKSQFTKGNIIQRVQELVLEGLVQDVSVKLVAEKVFLHPVYLSKVYKAETGESLGDYIIRMRMDKAAFMLRHTHMKVYEITSELGYQSPQYFSKMFKKVYGLGPQEYRDQ